MKVVIVAAAALLVLAGCSKDEPPVAPEADLSAEGADMQAAVPDQAAPPPAPAPNPSADPIQQDLNNIPLTLQNQDYATAVDQLGAMGSFQGQMTEAQKQAYQQQLFNTQQYLIEQAKRDAAAQQALDRLGRQVMGR